MIYLAADHRGFELKESLKRWLEEQNYQIVDVGATEIDPEDDYVDLVVKACQQMTIEDKGLFFCGSGHGVEMTANRFPQIRAILGFNKEVAIQGREHEDANVLSLAADWLSVEEATTIVAAFLTTSFSQAERHVRRLQKLSELSL